MERFNPVSTTMLAFYTLQFCTTANFLGNDTMQKTLVLQLFLPESNKTFNELLHCPEGLTKMLTWDWTVTDAIVPFMAFSNTTIISPSGSKCLADIHFLTDSSHFKGKYIFTIQFTRNSAWEQLSNSALFSLMHYISRENFYTTCNCILLIK